MYEGDFPQVTFCTDILIPILSLANVDIQSEYGGDTVEFCTLPLVEDQLGLTSASACP